MKERDLSAAAIGRRESILGLGREEELLRLMGDAQEGLNIVHVAGTNGKGSFCAMLASVLKSAGHRVGAFNSPALLGQEDGFRIDGARPGAEELAEILAFIAPLADQMEERPTEFEVLTAAAFELFKRENCDICIVECGLGGDGDSTNVIKTPVLSVITNVALDHTDRLGRTIPEIASHKAGIIKEKRPVLFGGRSPEALPVIEKKAGETCSELTVTDLSGLSVLEYSLDGTEIEYAGFGRLRLGLLGACQPENAANVLTAVSLLRREGFAISKDAVARGLAEARWEARFELVRREPCVIFDGAHNPDGVSKAAESIRRLFAGEKVCLLMGVMADKDYDKYPGMLSELALKVFTVKPQNPRSLGAEALAERFIGAGVPAEPCVSMESAVISACEYSEKNGVPLIAMGTLYMYNEFMEAFKAYSENNREDV